MKTKVFLAASFLLAVVLSAQNNYAQPVQPQPAVYQQKMQSASLLFMENKGQVADDKGNPQPNILFTANSGGTKVYVTATGIHYQFSKTEYPAGYDPSSKHLQKDEKQQEELGKQIKSSTHHFSVELQGANLQPAVSKQGQSEYSENYYLPQCPNGITGVHGYEKITLNNVYPNIDWVVYSKGGFMEYDFLVHPGGNPASIKLKIKDVDAVSITPQGELLMKTSLGEVREKAPVSYADGNIIASRFKQNRDGTIGFAVQSQPDKELRIDPSIVWSTYYGGSKSDFGMSCFTDKFKNVFLGGYTYSNSGLASGGFQDSVPDNIDKNIFLVKFNSDGLRIWATYYGGYGTDDVGVGTADTTGNIYLAGSSTSFGLGYNGFQNNHAGTSDALLVKFNQNGQRLWATYYGGPDGESFNFCKVDKFNNISLAGYTTSLTGIASTGAFQTVYGGGNSDAFIVKFNSEGNRLWATYYGGSLNDNAFSCAIDKNQNIYLAGQTASENGIAYNGHQNIQGGTLSIYPANDAFLVKFDSSGNRLWGTYYGGNDLDEGRSCVTDSSDNVYLIGHASSSANISYDGFQNSYAGSMDAFIVKFDSSGIRLWATYYGGSTYDYVYSGSIDKSSNVYISGFSYSPNIASGGFQNTLKGSMDGFLIKFNSTGNRIWCSYFGGNKSEIINSCASDDDYIYIAGETSSDTGIAVNGFQNIPGYTYSLPNYRTVQDAFLTKINSSKSIVILCPNGSTTITSSITGSTYQWEMSQDGITWVNVLGAITQTLSLTNLPSTSYGYQYRCKVNGTIYSDPYQLQFQNQWIGTTNTSWTNPANWSCGILPDGNTDVIINSGPVVLSSNGICRTLTVRTGVSFTVTTGNTLTITH